MITLINKNRDQPTSSRDRDSYYEDFEKNNLPKAEKGKTEILTLMACLHFLKRVQKIIILEQ